MPANGRWDLIRRLKVKPHILVVKKIMTIKNEFCVLLNAIMLKKKIC